MRKTRKLPPVLGLTTLSLLGAIYAPVVRAQTVLTGYHDNNATGDGFDAYTGSDSSSAYSYSVPADAGTPSATFNGNHGDGFSAPDYDTVGIAGGQFNQNGFDGFFFRQTDTTITGGQFDNNKRYGATDISSSVAISGGQFDNNNASGLYVDFGGTATITGGHFGGNYEGLYTSNSTVTISGGQFSDNSVGVGVAAVNNSVVTVNAGEFTGDAYGFEIGSNASLVVRGGVISSTNQTFVIDGDANSSGKIDVFGQFAGLSLGQTQILPRGPGSFTGTLQNNTGPSQAFSYLNSGTLTLHDVAPAPESSQAACLVMGVLGLVGLAFSARKRKTVA